MANHDWGRHRDFDLPQLRPHAGRVAAWAALPEVRRAHALGQTSIISVSFLDVDFIDIHLGQLQFAG